MASTFTDDEIQELLMILDPAQIAKDEETLLAITNGSVPFDMSPEEVFDRTLLYAFEQKPKTGSFSQHYGQLAQKNRFEIREELPNMPWNYALLISSVFEEYSGKDFFFNNVLSGMMLDSFARNFRIRYSDAANELAVLLQKRVGLKIGPDGIQELLDDFYGFTNGRFILHVEHPTFKVPEETPEFVEAILVPEEFESTAGKPENIPQVDDVEPVEQTQNLENPPEAAVEIISPVSVAEPFLPPSKSLVKFCEAENQVTVPLVHGFGLHLLNLALYDIYLLRGHERSELENLLLGSGSYLLVDGLVCSEKSKPFFDEIRKRHFFGSKKSIAIAKSDDELLALKHNIFLSELCLPTVLDYQLANLDGEMGELDLRRMPWLVIPTPTYYQTLFDFSPELLEPSNYSYAQVLAAMCCEIAKQPENMRNYQPHTALTIWLKHLLLNHPHDAKKFILDGASPKRIFPASLNRSTSAWLGLQTQILLSEFMSVYEKSKVKRADVQPLSWSAESFAPVLLTALREPLEDHAMFIKHSCKQNDYYQQPAEADYRIQQVLMFSAQTTKDVLTRPDHLQIENHSLKSFNSWHVYQFSKSLSRAPAAEDLQKSIRYLDAYIGQATKYGEVIPEKPSSSLVQATLAKLTDMGMATLHGSTVAPVKSVDYFLSWLLHVMPFWQVTRTVLADIEKLQQYHTNSYADLWTTWIEIMLPMLSYVVLHLQRSWMGLGHPTCFHAFDQITYHYLVEKKLTTENRISIGTLICFMQFSDRQRVPFSHNEHYYSDAVLLQMASSLATLFEGSHPELYSENVPSVLTRVHEPTMIAEALSSLSIVQAALIAARSHPAYELDETVERVSQWITKRQTILLDGWEKDRLSQPVENANSKPFKSISFPAAKVHRRAGNSVAHHRCKAKKPFSRSKRRIQVKIDPWIWDASLGRYVGNVDQLVSAGAFDQYPSFSEMQRMRSQIFYSEIDKILHDFPREVTTDLRGRLHSVYIMKAFSRLAQSGRFPAGHLFKPGSSFECLEPFVVFVLPDAYFRAFVGRMKGMTREESASFAESLATSFVTTRVSGEQELLLSYLGNHYISWPAILAQNMTVPRPQPRGLELLGSGEPQYCIPLSKPLSLAYVS